VREFRVLRPDAERAAREDAWTIRRSTEVTFAEIYAKLGEKKMGFDAITAEQFAQLENDVLRKGSASSPSICSGLCQASASVRR
jgi:hypothetical protein